MAPRCFVWTFSKNQPGLEMKIRLSIEDDEEPFLFLSIWDKITPEGEITLACGKNFCFQIRKKS
jgi:hypothetical protein